MQGIDPTGSEEPFKTTTTEEGDMELELGEERMTMQGHIKVEGRSAHVARVEP
jgi:hypothetical protein